MASDTLVHRTWWQVHPVSNIPERVAFILDLPQVDPDVSEAAWREIDLFRLQEYTYD